VDLHGARCLLTGGSSGIGRAAASALAAKGAHVVVAGRDAVRTRAVAGEVGGTPVVADLGDSPQVARLALEAGPIDVLVNNAGSGSATPFAEIAPETIGELISLNLTASLLLTRSLLPGMLDRGRGHVVMIASVAGHVGVRNEAAYAATKAGLITFAESLQQELAGTPIGVSIVSPGVVDTPFFDRRGRSYERRRPRPLPPERVAEAIVLAIERNRAEIVVPRWLAFPIRLHGVAPGLYRWAATRWG
jgi:short-subunit dehydrogenase